MARDSVLVGVGEVVFRRPGRWPREILRAAAPRRHRAADRRVEEHDHRPCNLASRFPHIKEFGLGAQACLGRPVLPGPLGSRPPRTWRLIGAGPHQLGTSLAVRNLHKQGVIAPNPAVNRLLGGSVLQRVADNRRTWRLGAGGRWFESSRPDHFSEDLWVTYRSQPDPTATSIQM